MTLYEIDQGIEEALNKVVVDEETGEVTVTQDLEALEKLQMERDSKVEGVCLFVKNADAESKAIAEEIKKLQARKKVLDKKAEGAKTWVSMALAGEKFSTPKCAVSFRKTESTEVDDLWKIPEEYLTYEDPKPDRVAIKKAIKEGLEVPGCHLEEKTSCTIK